MLKRLLFVGLLCLIASVAHAQTTTQTLSWSHVTNPLATVQTYVFTEVTIVSGQGQPPATLAATCTAPIATAPAGATASCSAKLPINLVAGNSLTLTVTDPATGLSAFSQPFTYAVAPPPPPPPPAGTPPAAPFISAVTITISVP